MFILLSIGVVGSLFLAGAVHANDDSGATVLHDVGLCFMLGSDADGNPVTDQVNFGTRTLVLENAKKIMNKCKGSGIKNDSGTGQSYSGFLCAVLTPANTLLGATDSHATVSASGEATLNCTRAK